VTALNGFSNCAAAAAGMTDATAVGDLVVIRSNGSDGGRFPLHTDAVIGRSAECDVRVKHAAVSRTHARVELRDGGCAAWLCPVSTAGATTLNGAALESGREARLRHCDIIGVANVLFRFEYKRHEGAERTAMAAAAPPLASAPLSTLQDASNMSTLPVCVCALMPVARPRLVCLSLLVPKRTPGFEFLIEIAHAGLGAATVPVIMRAWQRRWWWNMRPRR
jgi:hypothetical protein